MLHVAFLRSPRAHAVIAALDVEPARTLPGVVAVYTAVDLAGIVKPIRAASGTPGYQACDWPVLADGRVRMVGELIAMVVATSRYLAEDAVQAIVVELTPLTPLLTIEQSLADDAPRIHDDVEGNLFNRFETSTGDVEEAFAGAAHVVELEIRQQRYGAVAMEGRVAAASYNPGADELTMWMSTQVPHVARTGIARHLGMPETRVRVIAPDVGGGFGPKCVLYPEDLAVASAAKLLGRPVGWTSDRSEDLQATIQGREQLMRVYTAADDDGRVRAVRSEMYAANGAYAPWPYTAALDSGQASENVTGPYDIPRYERRVRAVVTNKAPMGPYRGVGRVIACLAMERTMDTLARRLDLDLLEIRRRNLVRSFPHETAVGQRFESGDYVRMLDLLEEAIEWRALRAENAALRERDVIRGLGVALAVEHGAYGPRALGARKLELTPGYDSAAIRVEPDGRVRVAVGLHNHGQGHETTIAQIAAVELGIAPEQVDVVWGDTAVVPYGLGTWGSRSTVACGGATILAARDVRARVLELAAHLLEASAGDLELADGVAFVRGSPSRRVSFDQIAHLAVHRPELLPDGFEPGLDATRRFAPPDPGSFSSSAHGALVELDGDTGEVRVLRYVVSEDCGTIVNPTIVEGQVHGGVAQGIGGALYEHLVSDAQGNFLTASLMDYLVPTAAEIPPIDVVHLESPSPLVPGGFKGMGEGGAVNSPAAIVSAVNDALRPYGVVADHTPITPEWILAALRRAPARA
jgi:carbon-monoxide dehydrogenase large subunit